MADMHYVSYDPDAMWEAMQTAYYEASGGILYPGDEKEILLRAVQSILISAYAAHDYAALMRTLRYAVGEYLDLIGDTRGVARIAASKAEADAEVKLRGNGTITLPKGTVFTNNGIEFFETTKMVQCTIGGEEGTVRVTVRCTEAGERGNGYRLGSTLLPVVGSKTIVQATLSTESAGGREKEDDESYRARIRSGTMTGSTTGMAIAYRARVMAVSTDVWDAMALRGDEGTVEIYVLMAEGISQAEKDDLLLEIEDALSEQTARPLTDVVNVQEAGLIPYTMTVECTYSTAEDVSATIEAAVKEYRTWQEQTIGRAFDPFKLVSLLYNAGATRVEINPARSRFDGDKPVAHYPVSKGKAVRGTVVIEPIREREAGA